MRFALPVPPLNEQTTIVAFLERETANARRPHRRSRARHRPAARTPHRADLRRRHRQDRRARPRRIGGRMSLHKEINFEDEICEHLAAHGWLYAEGDAAQLRPRAGAVPRRRAGVGAGDAAEGVGGARPRTTAPRPARRCSTACAISSTSAARSTCCATASSCSGLRQPLTLAQFKPALAINPDILARYAANRLRVVRQVRYSLHNENCIDLVLFLNGLPVATVGAEDRLHAEHRRRDRPVPLRPPSRGPRARPPSRCCPSRAARWCTSPSATAKST